MTIYSWCQEVTLFPRTFNYLPWTRNTINCIKYPLDWRAEYKFKNV